MKRRVRDVTRYGQGRANTMQEERENQERQVVHVIRKGPKQEIRISLSKFKGRTFGDLRTFLCNQAGEVVPTPKGVTVPVENFAELEMAVRKLREVVSGGPTPAREDSR
jgi:hypothetical protein